MPRLPNRRITEYLTPQFMYIKRLPTFVDVYRHFLFVFVANYAITKKETFDRLIEIWKESSLPTYVENSALKKRTRYLDEVILLRKSINSPKYEEYCEKISLNMTNYLIFARVSAKVLSAPVHGRREFQYLRFHS